MTRHILHTLLHSAVAICLFAGSTFAADTVVQVTSPTQQNADDSVNWSQLGADNTVLNASFTAASAKGASDTVSLTAAGSVTSVVCSATPCSWTGSGFTAGDTLLWSSDTSNGGTGPITISFGSAVTGVGAYIQNNAAGTFTAQIQVLNGSTTLATYTAASDANGDAVYLGAYDQSGSNITSVVFSITAGSGTLTDFGLDKLYINSGQATACEFTVQPTSQNLSSAAQQGTPISVTTQNGCAWTATSNAAWISITSGASGTGGGTVDYSVTANTTGASRQGTMTIAGQTFTVNQSASTTVGSGLQFVPITPCRVADTRNATGPFGGPILAANSTRAFAIRNSACNIPATAMAYSVNVTVVPSGSLGYLTIWPYGSAKPTASTLNSDGRVKANAAILPAGTDAGGSVNVYVTNATQFVLDIDGYFIQPGGTQTGLDFYNITPCRIADTRKANGPLGGPSMSAGSTRSFPVATACNIPAAATAYSLNFTVVPKGAVGYITAWPEGQTKPLASVLNDPTGTTVANAAIIPAGTPSGGVSVYTTDNTDLVIDINGYFAAPGTNGLTLYTLSPCRVLDTRNAGGAFDGKLVVNVETSSCNVNASAQAYVLNATVVPSGDLGYLTLWPDGQAQPTVSTLNALDGTITSNMALVPTTNGNIDAFSSGSTQLVLDISSYFAP